MTTTTGFLQQPLPLVFSSGLSSTSKVRVIRERSSNSSRIDARNPNPIPFICCCCCCCCDVGGLEDHTPCSSSLSSFSSIKSTDESHRGDISTRHRRRGLTLMAGISILLPLHSSAKLVARGESSIIRNGVRNILSKARAASVLRMVFHDAGTFDLFDNSGGMNGSIVYELGRPENAGLGKTIKILEKAKREIEEIQQVSWADLIAVAGTEAVSLCGGPAIAVRLGRQDARMPDPQGKLPEESLDASDLKRCFLKKGFSTQELVALCGAHTLGSKGFGNPNVFDNAYFKILLEKPWTFPASMSSMIGLPSDRALVEDDECLGWIKVYAGDEGHFFDDFKNAYTKLVDSGASWTTAEVEIYV